MHEFFLPAATINQGKRYSNIPVSIHPFPVRYIYQPLVFPFRRSPIFTMQLLGGKSEKQGDVGR